MWVKTEGTLEIYVNDETRKVERGVLDNKTVWPYAWNSKSRVWDNVSGHYTLAGLKRTKRTIEWH